MSKNDYDIVEDGLEFNENYNQSTDDWQALEVGTTVEYYNEKDKSFPHLKGEIVSIDYKQRKYTLNVDDGDNFLHIVYAGYCWAVI